MLNSTPRAPQVVAEYLSAAYEKTTGRIVHLHKTTVLQGGDNPGLPQRAEHALAAMKAMAGARSTPDVEVADVDPKSYRAGQTHRFDLRARRLVATPKAPARHRT